MKVRVAVRGRFHAFDLARELAALGALERLVTSYPAHVARRFGVPSERTTSLVTHECAARVARRLPLALAQSLEARVAGAFARASARRTDAPDVLVAFSGQALEQIAPARARGALVVLERGSAHIETQRELLAAEADRLGVRVRLPHRTTVARECEEYEAVDRIAVPSQFAAESFVARGIPRSRLIVNPYGVDLTGFRPAERPPERFRLLCVGRVSVQKGSHLLVDAFRRAGVDGELVFVGPVEPELHTFVRRSRSDRIRFIGPVPQARLVDHYHQASAFALASIQEGLAMVLLQAMACGLPIVASDHTGIAGLFGERDGVRTVRAGDVDALAGAIRAVHALGDARRDAGRAAARAVREGFSWADYGARALGAYRAALVERTPFAWPARSPERNRWVPPHRRRQVA